MNNRQIETFSPASARRWANPDEHVVLPDVISKEPLGPIEIFERRLGKRSPLQLERGSTRCGRGAA